MHKRGEAGGLLEHAVHIPQPYLKSPETGGKVEAQCSHLGIATHLSLETHKRDMKVTTVCSPQLFVSPASSTQRRSTFHGQKLGSPGYKQVTNLWFLSFYIDCIKRLFVQGNKKTLLCPLPTPSKQVLY